MADAQAAQVREQIAYSFKWELSAQLKPIRCQQVLGDGKTHR